MIMERFQRTVIEEQLKRHYFGFYETGFEFAVYPARGLLNRGSFPGRPGVGFVLVGREEGDQ